MTTEKTARQKLEQFMLRYGGLEDAQVEWDRLFQDAIDEAYRKGRHDMYMDQEGDV